MRAAPKVLVVDDNPGDTALVREELEGSQHACCVSYASDGEEALAFLRGAGSAAGHAPPDLIILDLSLPRRSGESVLVELRSDPHLREIPVLVLSTSRSNRDIVRSYQLGANCYLSKPGNLNDFRATVKMIGDFIRTRGGHYGDAGQF